MIDILKNGGNTMYKRIEILSKNELSTLKLYNIDKKIIEEVKKQDFVTADVKMDTAGNLMINLYDDDLTKVKTMTFE